VEYSKAGFFLRNLHKFNEECFSSSARRAAVEPSKSSNPVAIISSSSRKESVAVTKNLIGLLAEQSLEIRQLRAEAEDLRKKWRDTWAGEIAAQTLSKPAGNVSAAPLPENLRQLLVNPGGDLTAAPLAENYDDRRFSAAAEFLAGMRARLKKLALEEEELQKEVKMA